MRASRDPLSQPAFYARARAGTVFEDRQSWRAHEMATQYTFKGRKGETLRKEPGSIAGQPFDLADLEDCEVCAAARAL